MWYRINVGIKRKRCYVVTISALIGVSNTIVDSRASFLSTEPTNNTFSAPVFNVGGALQTSIKNFVIGGAMGFDYMLSDYAKSWHYNGRPWYGVMFGYRSILQNQECLLKLVKSLYHLVQNN